MDTRLRQIVPKGPGVYFIVTDNSQVAEIEAESRLRVIFINSQQGPVNCLVKFAQNDTASFTATFGKASRTKEKKGDFGHKVCLDALKAGPIGVINLRTFDETRDLTQVATINPNTKLTTAVREAKVPYSDLFNKNGYWNPRKENVTEKYFSTTGFLNFGNVSTNDVSLFVVKAPESDVANLTDQFDETLENTTLEITDYPGINWNMRLKDTFVKVYVFQNAFMNAHNNQSYGQYFDANDKVRLDQLDELSNVASASFVGSYVGSVIPELVTESGAQVSIDVVMFQDYMKTGIICDINNELLEASITDNGMIDLFGFDSMMTLTGDFMTIPSFMSYPDFIYTFDKDTLIPVTPSTRYDNRPVSTNNALKYGVESTTITDSTFVTNSSTGINIDDFMIGEHGLVRIKNITLHDEIVETKTEVIFDGDEFKPEDANVVYSNGKYYCINSNKWLESNDGKIWSIIDIDFCTTPSGNPIKFINIVNNAVAVSGKVVAVGYCPVEQANYVVVYENGNAIFYKLAGTGSQNINITYASGTYLVYGANVYYSNDSRSWTLSTSHNVLAAQYIPNLSGAKFIALFDMSSFNDDYSTDFINDFAIKISFDGITWSEIKSTYSSITPGEVRATQNGFLFDDTNIYIVSKGKVWTIQKSKLNVEGESWTGIDIDSELGLTNSKVFPYLGTSQSTTTANIIVNTKNGDVNKTLIINKTSNTLTVGDGPQVDSDDFFASRWFNLSNGYHIATGISDEVPTYYFVTNEITEATFNCTYDLVYSKATYGADGSLKVFGTGDNKYVVKVNPYVEKGSTLLNKFVIESYKPSESQFIDGTAARQEEILDVMNSQAIVKGLRGTTGIAYFVDAFKSYIRPGYKRQFGTLNNTMHDSNRFTRAIVNEPFISDLLKSTNPLFKTNPGDDTLNYEYIAVGGNKLYSKTLLTKFTDGEGSGWCFFVGPGDMIGGMEKPNTGWVSNLFYQKRNVFDVAANETGRISGINELAENFDEVNDLKFLQKFSYNPIMNINGDITLYGNQSGQRVVSKQQQWHNVELLCYIKENLYNMARPDIFKKGTYDEYLATQTNVEEFMNSLVIANAVKGNPAPIVKCDLENNTAEIQSYKIKLVHVEYVPYDCIEKVVFDIQVNK